MAEKLALLGGTPIRTKPFKIWPAATIVGKRYLQKVVNSNGWGIFRGSKIKEFGARFAKYHGAKYGIPCANATVALEVQLKAAGVKAGDEVITTVFSCISTISGILAVGAIPIFIDVDELGCIDPMKVAEKITPKTKAVIPVHLYDSLADLDALVRICQKYKLPLIEDAAQMPGAFWRKRGVGTYGISGSFSFQEAKVMTAGEGGIIITSDRELFEVIQSYINCGRVSADYRTRRRVLGMNARMTEFQAAILLAQLESLKKATLLRAKHAKMLTRGLKKISGIEVVNPRHQVSVQGYYFYTFRVNEKTLGVSRDVFIKALNAEGIPTRNTFVPLYRDPLFNLNNFDAPYAYQYFKKYPFSPEKFPIAEKLSREIVALWHPLLSGPKRDIADIIAAVKKVAINVGELKKQ